MLNEEHGSESLRPWLCGPEGGGSGPVKVMGRVQILLCGTCRVQCETGRSGRRVWMIFGLGLVFGSSSSSASLSQTWTTTLGVDSVPA